MHFTRETEPTSVCVRRCQTSAERVRRERSLYSPCSGRRCRGADAVTGRPATVRQRTRRRADRTTSVCRRYSRRRRRCSRQNDADRRRSAAPAACSDGKHACSAPATGLYASRRRDSPRQQQQQQQARNSDSRSDTVDRTAFVGRREGGFAPRRRHGAESAVCENGEFIARRQQSDRQAEVVGRSSTDAAGDCGIRVGGSRRGGRRTRDGAGRRRGHGRRG